MVDNNENKLAAEECVEQIEEDKSNNTEDNHTPRCHQEPVENPEPQNEQQEPEQQPIPHPQPQPQPQPHLQHQHQHPHPHRIRLHFHCNAHHRRHPNPAQQNPQPPQMNQGVHPHPNQPMQLHRHANPLIHHHHHHPHARAHVHVRSVRPMHRANSNPINADGAAHQHLPVNNDHQPVDNNAQPEPVVAEEAQPPPGANEDNQQPEPLRNANPNQHEDGCPHHQPGANNNDNGQQQQHLPNANHHHHHLNNGNPHHNHLGNGMHHHHHGILHNHHNGHGNHHHHHHPHPPVGNHHHHHHSNEGNQQLPELRSKMSHTKSFLNIKNLTEGQVDVIWIDYRGNNVLYRTLNQGETLVNIDTYVTHPWIFLDKRTKCRLIADYLGEPHMVLMPKPWFLKMRRSDLFGQVSPRRITVNIKLPLYSLKDRAEQIVRQNLKDPKSAFELEIPQNLIDRLTRTEGED